MAMGLVIPLVLCLVLLATLVVAASVRSAQISRQEELRD